MARLRLGRQERAERKAQYAIVRTAKREVILANLSGPKPEPVRYATASTKFEASMTHGMYRGLYDPTFSTDKDTARGLTVRKTTVAKPWYVTKDKGRVI